MPFDASGYLLEISGLVTEADPDNWKLTDFVPYIRHIVDTFGPERIMFGSDWPVCLLAASYDQVVSVLEEALPPAWGERERRLLFGDNAMRFFQL